MNSSTEQPRAHASESSMINPASRRQFFQDCGVGLGKIALASLLTRDGWAAPGVGRPHPPMAPPKAKNVIYLFMAGAPSHLDLFDEKPKLRELEGRPLPPSVIGGQRYAFIQPDAAVLGPRFSFNTVGQSGARIADVLPYFKEIVDEVAMIHSVHTDQFNHAPAQIMANTGSPLPGRPAMGAWLSYGLGSPANDLPAFVVLKSGGSLSGGASMWSSGFLPSSHQGVPFRDGPQPILHVGSPEGIDRRTQRQTLDFIGAMNRHRESTIGDPDIRSRTESFETAFRMQRRAPELMDLSKESDATLQAYGLERGGANGGFAYHCLMARRLVERGVRFVQVYNAGWDHHSNVEGGLRSKAKEIDAPVAALLKDLKRRGLLDETLVVWGGEFGRTPMVEASAALGRSKGRDHHPQAFTMWMAGGGVRPGIRLGATDELGFHIERDPVHVHDLQATILALLGLDHKRLTFRLQGRDFRLTDVGGRIVQPLLA